MTIQEILKEIYGLEVKLERLKPGSIRHIESTEALLHFYKLYVSHTKNFYEFCCNCHLTAVNCICGRVEQFFENCHGLPTARKKEGSDLSWTIPNTKTLRLLKI